MGILFKKNLTFAEGGGLTSKLVPYQLTKTGIGVGMGIGSAAALGSEMLANRNRMRMGPIIYTGGPARMTNNFSSGAIEAIQEATNDPAVRADMLKRILHTDDGIINNIEEFGVDSSFLSAFYGMG